MVHSVYKTSIYEHVATVNIQIGMYTNATILFIFLKPLKNTFHVFFIIYNNVKTHVNKQGLASKIGKQFFLQSSKKYFLTVSKVWKHFCDTVGMYVGICVSTLCNFNKPCKLG